MLLFGGGVSVMGSMLPTPLHPINTCTHTYLWVVMQLLAQQVAQCVVFQPDCERSCCPHLGVRLVVDCLVHASREDELGVALRLVHFCVVVVVVVVVVVLLRLCAERCSHASYCCDILLVLLRLVPRCCWCQLWQHQRLYGRLEILCPSDTQAETV